MVVNSGTVVAAFVFTNSTVVAGIGVADSVVKGVAVSSSAGKSVNSIDITDAVADGDGVYVSVSRREDVVAAAVSANSTVANRTRSVAAGIVVAVALKAVVAVRFISRQGSRINCGQQRLVADGDIVSISISRSADVVAATFVASSAVANLLPSAAAGTGVANSVVEGVAASSSAGKSVNSIDKTDAVADGDGVYVSVSRREDVVAAAVSANSTVTNRTRSDAAGIAVADPAVEGAAVPSSSRQEQLNPLRITEVVPDQRRRKRFCIPDAKMWQPLQFVATSAVANFLPSVAARIAVADPAVDGSAVSSSAVQGSRIHCDNGCYRRRRRRKWFCAPTRGRGSRCCFCATSSCCQLNCRLLPLGPGSADCGRRKAWQSSSSAGKAVESTAVTEVVADGDSVSISTSLRADVVSATFVASFAVANWLPSAAAGTGVADSVVEGVVVASTAITEAIAVRRRRKCFFAPTHGRCSG